MNDKTNETRTVIIADDLGDCYEVHAHCLMESEAVPGQTVLGEEVQITLVLVHGIVDPDRSKIPAHGHAWLEDTDGTVCIDLSRGQSVFCPRDTYYRIGNIDPATCHRYTRDEMITYLLSHEHYGPWEGPDAVPPLNERSPE